MAKSNTAISETPVLGEGYHWDTLAPRPKKLSDTGLSLDYLCDLVSKHLLNAGAISLTELSERILLPGAVIDDVLQFLRKEARIEVLGMALEKQGLRYNLTDRGRNFALQAQMRGGYVGPAPVSLEDYVALVEAQSIHGRPVSKEMIDELFATVVVDEDLKNQLGLAVNSGRATFVYGPAGSGKTYLTGKLARVFGDTVLIPHAIAIGEITLPVYDPVMHTAVGGHAPVETDVLALDQGYDARYQRCERPVVVVGGELVDSMLDVQYDESNKVHMAPLQLKANNGVFIIDDMGRQKVPPEVIFNRWIVPLEEKVDYLSVGAGRHFTVPFDEVLIFSTNMHPLDLADEAFLRRIGYKIAFSPLTREEYISIWNDVCSERGITCDQSVIDFVIDELHLKVGTPLMACHPRDLIGIAVDYTVYKGQPKMLTNDHVAAAWSNYFVSLTEDEKGSTNSSIVEE